VVVFVLMSAVDGVGDNHPGHKVPFWENACRADRTGACDVLDGILRNYCQDGSGWACNERGMLRAQGRIMAGESLADFSSACAAGFQAGCENMERVRASRPPREAPPQLADYPVILRTGKGALPDRTPAALFTRACDQGWMEGCSDLAGVYLQGRDRPRDPARARALLEQACSAGVATACSNLGYMHQSGDGVPQDVDKGIGYLKKGCDLGFERACTWLAEHEGTPRTAARP